MKKYLWPVLLCLATGLAFAAGGKKKPALLDEPAPGASLMEKARTYHENADTLYSSKDYVSALEYYKKYLEISPADPAAAERKFMCEVELGKQEALAKSEEALTLLDEYEEESARGASLNAPSQRTYMEGLARDKYSETMRILERLRQQVPWDEDVQALYAELSAAFEDDTVTNGADENMISLSVDSVEIAPLFPVLRNLYMTDPAGFINVSNTGKSPVKNLKVSASMRRYMDFASEGETVATLKPGASASVEIRS